MINKNPDPLVSIVIAACKSDHEYFLAAINSALKQTYSNIEVLVADDSPSDCLLQLVRGLDDSRIQYFNNNVPLGVAMNHWKAF
jgi:glycosyltransferase involved in cell wall biosynthesis